jgi:hypothetical protein
VPTFRDDAHGFRSVNERFTWPAYTGSEVHRRKECPVDAIHLPGVTLPTTLGQPAQASPPGQLIQALVLELLESNVFRLQLPQAVVDVRSDVPLTPGSMITLAVKGAGPNTRLVIYADLPPAGTGQGSPASSLPARQPIGEAVVIARAPAATPNRIAEPLAPDAPPLAPVRPPVPMPDVSPERALSEAVRAAASRQSGMAPLFADVEQVVTVREIPSPVRAATQGLLGLRVPLDEKLTPAGVKQAFVRSGVLFEPRLAAAKMAPAADREGLTPAPANDMKAALLVLRQVVKAWSAAEPAPTRTLTSAPPTIPGTPETVVRPAPLPSIDTVKHVANALAGLPDKPMPQSAPLSPEQATSLARALSTALETGDTQLAPIARGPNSALPPPYRGAPLAAQPPAAPSIMPDATPHEIADRLVAHTDGALARQTLLQAASLPDQPQAQRVDAGQRWSFEVPFATPQGTAIAQFEVSRDARAAKADPQVRTWRARFSLDVEPMGPVHASIALSGERASVTLWAERHATAARLNDQAPALGEALRAAELSLSDVQFRVGAPPVVARQAAPGRFMDRAT